MSNFLPPLSGVVLAKVVDAFQLRVFDKSGLLADRTASRFLAGDRLGPESELKIWHAVAEAIIAADLLPPGLPIGDAKADPEIDTVSPALAALPPATVLAKVLHVYAQHWDAVAGAIRRLAPAVAYENLCIGACMRVAIIDLTVRLAGVLWLMRMHPQEPLPVHWAVNRGVAHWLRELHRKCSPQITRDGLATKVRVDGKTLDTWFDQDVRPSDENLQDLAAAFAAHSIGVRQQLIRQFRLMYGLRDLFIEIRKVAGDFQTDDLAERLMVYPTWMLNLMKASRRPLEVDLKARLAMTQGTIPIPVPAECVAPMLNHVRRHERDPVWRTAIGEATGPWFNHLVTVTTKLPPTAPGQFEAALGMLPPLAVQEQFAYLVLASKEELAQDPLIQAGMDAQLAAGGPAAALELKLRAIEAARKGDLVTAIALCRKAVSQDPCNAELHFRLGADLWQIGDDVAGLAELEIAVQLDPGWDRSQVEVAILLLNLGREREAVQRLEAAGPLLRAPSTWHQLHLAHAYDRIGDTQQAVKHYETLIASDSNQGEALDRLAHLYFVLGDKRKGAECAKEAAHLGFTDVMAAWSNGYYAGNKPRPRPPRTTPAHLVHLGDRSWKSK